MVLILMMRSPESKSLGPETTTRPIWRGTIGFGIVNIPVRLYLGESPRGLKLNLLHRPDNSPIGRPYVCKLGHEEVAQGDLVHGYQYSKGRYVVLENAELVAANVAKTCRIEIHEFVRRSEIDPVYFTRPYFLEPDRGTDKPYAILREALRRSRRVGIATFVLREREQLGAVRVWGKSIVLNGMRFENEVRSQEKLDLPTGRVRKAELDMALTLINLMRGSLRLTDYRDTYRNDIMDLIQQKVQGLKPEPMGELPRPTAADELMRALKRSVEQAQRTRAEAQSLP